MSNKCVSCGLANWQGATQCSRCKAELGTSQMISLNPFENEKEKGSGGTLRNVGLLFLGIVIIFSVYYLTTASVSSEAKRMAETVPYAKARKATQAELPELSPEESDRRNKEKMRQWLETPEGRKDVNRALQNPVSRDKSKEQWCQYNGQFAPCH